MGTSQTTTITAQFFTAVPNYSVSILAQVPNAAVVFSQAWWGATAPHPASTVHCSRNGEITSGTALRI
eukprot:3953026-Amphidinium_carterae.1